MSFNELASDFIQTILFSTVESVSTLITSYYCFEYLISLSFQELKIKGILPAKSGIILFTEIEGETFLGLKIIFIIKEANR